MLTLLLSIFVAEAVEAEMFVWVDSDGFKHISTHPKECFQGKKLPYNMCAPLAGYRKRQGEEIMTNPNVGDKVMPEGECEELKRRRDRLSKQIQVAQQSVNDMAHRATKDIGALNADIGGLIEMPRKLRRLQKEMLSTDKKYDRCFPDEQLSSRRSARKSIRELTERKIQAYRQEQLIRNIGNQLQEIERILKVTK